MKNNPISLIFISLLLVSCNKNDIKKDDIEEELYLDEIINIDIIPDMELKSVHSFYYYEQHLTTCTVPVPEEDSVFYQIDINNDSVFDFNIAAYHYKFLSESHCEYEYNIVITIQGISPGDSIVGRDIWGNTVFFNVNDTINNQNLWSDQFYFLIAQTEGGGTGIYTDFPDSFIGIKKDNNLGYIKVSKSGIYGIVIEEYAYNNADYADIICGQIKLNQ